MIKAVMCPDDRPPSQDSCSLIDAQLFSELITQHKLLTLNHSNIFQPIDTTHTRANPHKHTYSCMKGHIFIHAHMRGQAEAFGPK